MVARKACVYCGGLIALTVCMDRGEMSKSAFSRAQGLLIAAHTDRQNLLAAREAVDLNFDRSQYCQNYNESLSGSRVNVFT